MKKLLYIFPAILLAFACTPDEAALKGQLDDLGKRLKSLEEGIASVNSQVEALGTITQGNVITSLKEDSDGNYVITYLGSDDKEYSVVVATKEQMLNIPQLTVSLDEEEGIYYWTLTQADGTETDLLDASGKRVPVSGSAPKISTDSGGYWTVDGVRLLDASGQPIEARDGETCIFRSIRVNEDGDMEVVLGGGKTIVLPMQQVLNLTLSQPINGTAPDSFPATLDLDYAVTGSAASSAIVAISGAYGLTATLNKEESKIRLSFPLGFTGGYVVVVAYDRGTHSVIRPVFFGEGITPEPPTPPVVVAGISTAAELVEFASLVNSSGDYSKFQKADGSINLLNDIDLGDVSASWTPIGLATASSTNDIDFTIGGHPFTGVFNGGGHSISGFNPTVSTATGETFGLFGVISGASVSNLTLSGTLTASATGKSHVGTVVGVCYNSAVNKVTSNVKITSAGTTSSSQRFAIGGIVGLACNDGSAVTSITSCTMNGDATVDKGSNSGIGATAVIYGGIVAYSSAQGSDMHTLVTSCVNNGTMTMNVGRAAGIVGSCKQYTKMSDCINNGMQINSSAKNRLGQITCELAGNCRMDDCINNGDLIANGTAAGNDDIRLGGMVGALAAGTIEGGESNGRVVTNGHEQNAGLIFGHLAGATAVRNVAVKGLIGTWNDGDIQLKEVTAANFDTWNDSTIDASGRKYSFLGSCNSTQTGKVSACTLVP